MRFESKFDRARMQARAARWRIADELDLLAVHGILHLFGYDDRTPRKRAQMWQRQEEILGRVAGTTWNWIPDTRVTGIQPD